MDRSAALKQMAEHFPGGQVAVAAVLGLTVAGLRNRLYEVKGQRISCDEAVALSAASGSDAWVQSVCAELGGVFVRLPEASADRDDILAKFNELYAELGVLSQKFRELIADDEIQPDECVTALGGEQSAAQLRAQLVGRLAMVGGQSIAYFTELASTLGYQISISEYHAHSVNDDVDYPLFGIDWHFAWQVNAAINTVSELTVADTADDFLAAWGNTLLECVFRRLKPAHTLVLFSYT